MDLMLFDRVIAFDHYRQRVLLIAGVMTENLEESYEKAVQRLQEMAELVKAGEKKEFPVLKLHSEIRPQFPKRKILRYGRKGKSIISAREIFFRWFYPIP